MPIVQLIALKAAVPQGGDPPNQTYSVFSGNTVDVEVLITDQEQGPLDLTGCIVTYHLRQAGGSALPGFPKNALLSTEPDGQGKCTIRLLASETAAIAGTFSHLLVLSDPSDSPPDVTTVLIGNAQFKSGGV